MNDFKINSRVRINFPEEESLHNQTGRVVKNRKNTVLVELDSDNPVFIWKRNVVCL